MAYKDIFITALKSTNRKGIDNVIKQLEKLGFFKAPASSNYHLNVEGGLVRHSWNVYQEACLIAKCQIHLKKDLKNKLQDDSIIIASLLHDVCKTQIFRDKVKWEKDDSTGKWISHDGFKDDYSDFPFGHGDQSVIMLLKWKLDLTDDEMLAIKWHMGKFDLSDYQKKIFDTAISKCPLLQVIHTADMLATRCLE